MSKEETKQEKPQKVKKLVAKKDHVIFQNKERYNIKKGEEINVPKRFFEVLKTENVI
jgi:superfamily II helicase